MVGTRVAGAARLRPPRLSCIEFVPGVARITFVLHAVAGAASKLLHLLILRHASSGFLMAREAVPAMLARIMLSQAFFMTSAAGGSKRHSDIRMYAVTRVAAHAVLSMFALFPIGD